MIVGDFNTENIEGRKRVSANIIWEDADRGEEHIYFEVNEQYDEAISCSIDAFFLATLIPAIHYGEQRYEIKGKISSELYKGTLEALGWIYHIDSTDESLPVNLQVPTRGEAIENIPGGHAAWFLSGGIDSYATYFNNRTHFSEDHPRYIKDGIVAFGLATADPEKFDYVLSMLHDVANHIDVNLVPVFTNAYLIYRQDEIAHAHELWRFEFQGAMLAAIGHIFGNRISSISVPSSGTHDLETCYGNPLIDPNFSSHNLQVIPDGVRFTRFQKIQIVANNLPHSLPIRVCNDFKKYSHGHFNCGECEKCLCTMLGLLALGKLGEWDSFPYNDVTKEMIIKRSLRWKPDEAPFYRELITPLEKIGRDDLVEAVKYVLKRSERRERKLRLKSKLDNFDQKYFNGNLRTLKRAFRHPLN